MAGMRVEVDTKKVDTFLDTAPKKAGLAILRAVKRGTKSARTHAARVVSKDMGLKVGDVRNRIRIIEPTAQTFTGELRANLKRIPLIKFGARGPRPSRGRGRGVSYRSKGGRKRHPNAFIARMPSGHEGVFERKATKRLPIRELFGPSIGRVFDAHRGEIMARGADVATKELDRQVDRMLGASRG